MGVQNHERLKFDILPLFVFFCAFLIIAIYAHRQSHKILTIANIETIEVTISRVYPFSNDDGTGDIKFIFSEFPKSEFELSSYHIEQNRAVELISSISIGQKVWVDIEREQLNKQNAGSNFLGFTPSIQILGIRLLDNEDIPIYDYNVERNTLFYLIYWLSFIPLVFIGIALIRKLFF